MRPVVFIFAVLTVFLPPAGSSREPEQASGSAPESEKSARSQGERDLATSEHMEVDKTDLPSAEDGDETFGRSDSHVDFRDARNEYDGWEARTVILDDPPQVECPKCPPPPTMPPRKPPTQDQKDGE